jgi:hypothetical protein
MESARHRTALTICFPYCSTRCCFSTPSPPAIVFLSRWTTPSSRQPSGRVGKCQNQGRSPMLATARSQHRPVLYLFQVVRSSS